jgi:ribosomal protein S18 acetylase RimI-like enzyme
MLIRTMRDDDLDFAASCTRGEGWVSETREVFEAFYAHQPQGCFVAEENGQQVGVCVVTNYGASAFLGELIVVPEHRGKRLGASIMQHAIEALEQDGVQNVLLDGVPRAIPLYERLGFQKICRSLRFLGALRGVFSTHVRAMEREDLGVVARIDQEAFGADRRFFIERCLRIHPDLCRVLVEGGEVTGYVLGQPANGGLRIGPWVVRPGSEHAAQLPPSLLPPGREVTAGLGVLETNAAAIKIVRAMGFQEQENPPWRMVRGPSGNLASSDSLYAVGSAAKG